MTWSWCDGAIIGAAVIVIGLAIGTNARPLIETARAWWTDRFPRRTPPRAPGLDYTARRRKQLDRAMGQTERAPRSGWGRPS